MGNNENYSFLKFRGKSVKGNKIQIGTVAKVIIDDLPVTIDYVYAVLQTTLPLAEKLSIQEKNIRIGISIMLLSGLYHCDNCWYKESVLKNGKLKESICFSIKTSEMAKRDTGFYMSFDVNSVPLCSLFFTVHIVDEQ